MDNRVMRIMLFLSGLSTFFIHGQQQLKQCLVTIFVHGTLRPAEITLTSLQQIANDRVKNTLYARIIELMRPRLHFHRAQAMQGLGLQPIITYSVRPEYVSSELCTISPETCRAGAHCIADLFEHYYQYENDSSYDRLYYTFGWNGLLSLKERLGQAELFYDALEKEALLLQERGFEPQFQIFAFSHGGNVTLNLAAIKKKRASKPLFVIDKLVLLATPVQKETDIFVQDGELFKKIYHFYSTEDIIQANDIFSTKKEFCSNRIFRNRYNLKLPKNLIQIRFRVTKKIKRLPVYSSYVEPSYKLLVEKRLRFVHMDPDHTEFWNIQWGDPRYRQKMPLCPLPVLVYTPWIIKALETYCPDDCSVTFDYCPEFAGARILSAHPKRVTIVPMMNKELEGHMKLRAATCRPENYNFKQDYKEEKKTLKEIRKQLASNSFLMAYFSRERIRGAYNIVVNLLWPKKIKRRYA